MAMEGSARAQHACGVQAYLSASFAHVWLLARVDSSMNCQGGALDKLLLTAWMVAHVRADTSMYAFCDCVCQIM